MMTDKFEVERRFYEDVAKLLNTEYDYKPFPWARRNRWNNRHPGNGRYPSFGLVRMFSPTLVHVQLYSPSRLSAFFNSTEAALDAIRSITNVRDTPSD